MRKQTKTPRAVVKVGLVGLLLLPGVVGCPCEDAVPWDPADQCLQLERVSSEVVPPAGVRAVLRARGCDGEPLADIETADLTVLLDEERLRSEGETAPVITQEVEFEQYALVLLDLSDSIIANHRLESMVAAARDMTASLLDEGAAVAVYQFAGPPYFAEVAPFTRSASTLDAAFDHLEESTGLGSTDLYGALHRALSALESTGTAGVLSARTLVLFTDGTDEAHSTARSVAVEHVTRSEANVFTVGLGGDVDKDELGVFGKDGFEWVENAEELEDAFSRVAQRVRDLSRSHYLVAICSPRVGGDRTMQIRVRHEGKWGELVIPYSAEGFDLVGCDPLAVAYPCEDKECGSVGSSFCGACEDKQYCGEDYTCEEACEGFECGLSFGLSCGTCKEGLACVEHACVDPCESAECGTIQGVSCGDCSQAGPTFYCGLGNTCVDACDGLECGLSNGVVCGECDAGWSCVAGACEVVELEGVSFVLVPGQQVRLGCDPVEDPACGVDEPQRTVEVSGFFVLATEATVGMFEQCHDAADSSVDELEAGELCHEPWGSDKALPLNCVTWQGLRTLCQFLGGDLPTEAQFELAMRGDHDGVAASYWAYPWGNEAASCELAVMSEAGVGCGAGGVLEVGSRPATGLGLFDLSGNVAEWMLDYYTDLPSCSGAACVNPNGPSSGSERVVRGGAFDDLYASSLRSAARDKRAPDEAMSSIGGRCVRPM